MPDDDAKILAGVRAMLGGLTWTALLGVILFPLIHPMLHTLHLRMGEDEAR